MLFALLVERGFLTNWFVVDISYIYIKIGPDTGFRYPGLSILTLKNPRVPFSRPDLTGLKSGDSRARPNKLSTNTVPELICWGHLRLISSLVTIRTLFRRRLNTLF